MKLKELLLLLTTYYLIICFNSFEKCVKKRRMRIWRAVFFLSLLAGKISKI